MAFCWETGGTVISLQAQTKTLISIKTDRLQGFLTMNPGEVEELLTIDGSGFKKHCQEKLNSMKSSHV